MADLIKFPVILRARHARRAYQVASVRPERRRGRVRIITARDDVDAKRQRRFGRQEIARTLGEHPPRGRVRHV